MKTKWVSRGVFLLSAAIIAVTAGYTCAVTTNFNLKEQKPAVSRENREYLTDVARDTWDYLDSYVVKFTGMPYDGSSKGSNTSVTNIGFYMSSVVAAEELGFINKKEALERLNTTLDSMAKVRKWHGFPCIWVNCRTLKESNEVYSSADHLGNFVASVILARNAFPELKEKCNAILDPMQWGDLYDPDTKWLKGGYDIIHEAFPGNNWYYNFLGADTRLGSFFAIASGQVPPEHWDALNHNIEEKYGIDYLVPGWQGGGLFMQFTSGLFFDERGTLMGKSASNFAYAQIVHGQKTNSPVWGWSASNSPKNGYIGWGAMRDNVVTPHASALTVIYYPEKAVDNLRKLEELGARKEFNAGTENLNKRYGFRDAIDLDIKETTDGYLALDQAMLFLSLTNYLTDGALWKYFENDPFIIKGKSLIKECQDPPAEEMKKLKEVWAKRDTQTDFKSIIPLDLGLKEQGTKRVINDKVLQVAAPRVNVPLTIDGDLSDWQGIPQVDFNYKKSVESGELKAEDGFEPGFWLAWDDKYLYFAAKVKDKELITTKEKDQIWQDDCIEIFVDPDLDGIEWNNKKDFQIGLSPSGPAKKPQVWCWFQGVSGEPDILVASKTEGTGGYIIEAAIPWEFLHKSPKKGDIIGVSVAFHDKDSDREVKVNWCYLDGGKKLGRLSLE